MRNSHSLIPVVYEYLTVILYKIPFGFISQRFCHLDISAKYQHLTGPTILISMGRFFDAFTDVDN